MAASTRTKADALKELSEAADAWAWVESPALVYALAECLAPADKCSLLLTEHASRSVLRSALLKSIGADDGPDRERVYPRLAEDLLAMLVRATGKQAQSIGYCLVQVTAVFAPDDPALSSTIRALLGNRYVGNRRRGYHLLRKRFSIELLPAVKEAWEQHHDAHAMPLLLEHAPVDYLLQQRDELITIALEFRRPWLVNRLFIALGRHSLEHLAELKRVDGISYAYVITKLGSKLTDEEALCIFEENLGKDQLGLLLWSFGKQKLSDVLSEISQHWERYAERHVQQKQHQWCDDPSDSDDF